MSSIDEPSLGERAAKRLGYGALQLAGPRVFGPPKDRDAALAVVREAVALGANHFVTSVFNGPHGTNQLIRDALHPYPDDLVIVTNIGARRSTDGSWIPGLSPQELARAVQDNLRNLFALAWLLRRAPTILLIPGTSSPSGICGRTSNGIGNPISRGNKSVQ